MNPATIALFLSLIEQLIEDEPALETELKSIFSTPNPSPADWEASRAKVLSEDFASLAPNAAANLPPVSDAPDVTAPGPVTPAESQPDAATPPPAPAPEVSSAAGVTCPVCNQPLVANSPANCNCAPA